MRLLEGHVEEPDDPRDAEIESLHEDIRQLQAEVRTAQDEASRARRDVARMLGPLRKQLTPLYRALQAVFGELDSVGVTETDAPSATHSRTTAVWDAWKSRMGSTAKLIDALLLHGEMNTSQLAIATGFHRTTIPAHIFKLNKAGLINKNGGKFSLKSL